MAVVNIGCPRMAGIIKKFDKKNPSKRPSAHVQIDQAGTAFFELPHIFAISSMKWVDERYCHEEAIFQCTPRVVKLARHGFPWIKECNENLLFWLEEEFIQTAHGYWKLKTSPRGKTRLNMVYHFYAEKILW